MHVYAYVEMILRTERSPTALSWISASAEERVCQGLYDGEQLDASLQPYLLNRLEGGSWMLVPLLA
jgi:hypothetical protein